jgi:hypothetical protein
MHAALNQVYGYSTWRDSRLAFIFFVLPATPPPSSRRREPLGKRDEFDGWEHTRQRMRRHPR